MVFITEMSDKNGQNRGGAREGAGRKPVFDLGQAERENIIKEVRAAAEEKGTSFGQELGALMFGGKKAEKRTRLAAMQLYVRDVLPKVSEREVNEPKWTGPAVYLPEQRPALETIPNANEYVQDRGEKVAAIAGKAS